LQCNTAVRAADFNGIHVLGALRDLKGPAKCLSTATLTKSNAFRGKLGLAALDGALTKPMVTATALTVSQSQRLVCALQHPTTGCLGHFAESVFHSFKKLVPIYIPIYVIPMLIFNAKKLYKEPVKRIKQLVISVLRSSLFLGVFLGVGWSANCLIARKLGNTLVWTRLLPGIAAGLTILLEKKTRKST
jgi:hypothetical protein